MLTIDVNECLQEIPEIRIVESLYGHFQRIVPFSSQENNREHIDASLMEVFGSSLAA